MGKIVLLENATDIFLSVFKITKNVWQINTTIQHPIRFYTAYYIKHFLSVPRKSKSVHFQYIMDFSTIRDHSLFMTGGGLAKKGVGHEVFFTVKGGGAPKNIGSEWGSSYLL